LDQGRLDLDFLGPAVAIGRFRDVQGQHALGEVRRDAVAVGVGRQGECPREAAVAALRVVGFLIAPFDVLFAGDGQHIVLDKDLYILLVETRQLDADRVALAVLLHLDLRRVVEGAQGARLAIGHRLEPAILLG
jgi:hypothetical protein